MQYDSYRGKVNRVAAILGKMYARRLPILIALVALILVIAAMVVTKGLIVAETDCPTEVTYGDKLGYRVFVLWGRTTYEYREQGSTAWSTEKPVFPGNYQVRALGKTSLGETNYTDIHDFTVLPREITPTVADRSIEYGETPGVKADLAKGDQMSYTVQYESMTTSTRARIDPYSISITDQHGNDRMAGYVIVDTPMTALTVKPRSLQVTVQDASKVYDDVALSFDGYEITKGSLLEGDTLIAVFRATLTDAGTRKNTPELRVVGGMGDVTGFYDITVRSGTLTVEQRALIVRTGSVSYVYAGIEQSYPRYTLDPSTTLVSGHSLEVANAATILDCGTAENVLSFNVRNRAGGTETHNYAIFVEAGTLTVTPREVTVHTDSGTLVYDGTDQSYPYVTVENGVGDDYRAIQPATIRDVGQTENRMTVAFVRGDKDISFNYIIKGYTYGTVTVEPRPITVQIKNATKIFDKTVLKSNEFTFAKGNLARGHSMAIRTSGSVVFGTTENRYVEGSVLILDENVQDVTHNYDITVLNGTLTVTPRPLTITTGDAYKVYDGKPLTEKSFTFDRGALLEGHALNFKVVGTQTEAGYSKNTVDRDSVWVKDTATGEDVSQYYEIIYDEGILEVGPIRITVETRSGTWIYDGKTHYGSTDVTMTKGELLKGHYMIWESDAQTIRDAGSVKNAIYVDIRTADGEVMTHNYDIVYDFGILTVNRRPVTVRFRSTTVVYDGQPHVNTDCVLDDSSEYDFVLRHYPMVKEKNQVSYTNVGIYDILWKGKVDVYDPSEGRYVTDNYDLTVLNGSLAILKRPLTIRLDGSKVYDGKPLTDWHVTYLDSTSLAAGHILSAQPLGVPTDAVRAISEIDPDMDNFTITDEHGGDVLSNYSVKLEAGKFTVYKREIAVRSADAEKIYDGTPLTAPFGRVTEDSASLVEGHGLFLEVFGTGTEIGQYPNDYDPKSLVIWDENGNRDVTHNYDVARWEKGTLTVKYDVSVVVTTGSATKIYDKTPLVCDEYTVEIVRGMLPEGFAVNVDVIGRITRVGYTENTATVTVTDGEGNDVTALVVLDIRYGVLTVLETTDPDDPPEPPAIEKPILELIPAFCHKVYDGTYLYPADELVLTPMLAMLLEQGYTYTVRVAGLQKEIGDGESHVVTFTLYDSNGEDVTDEYELVRLDGLLRVTAPAVEVFLYPLDKVYDGRPAVWGREDYEIRYLPDGLTLELNIRVHIDVGFLTLAELNRDQSLYVTYRITQNGLDVTDRYPLAFTLPEGMEDVPVLTVKRRELELTAASETRVEDGTPLTNASVYLSKGMLADGHTLEAYAEGSQQGVGTAVNRVMTEAVVIRDASGRDVTHNYHVSAVDGSLTVMEAP
ncbi:MAG: hypothetical protein IJX72_04890 [Clostridia bacterium]|nr:hypothetical protein [Clostridia bacterium]